jgi:hypothetical protein
MSALNHLGIYLMISYLCYLIYIGRCIHTDRQAFEGAIDYFIGLISGLIILTILEIPYWIIYLCFIKYG